MLRLVPFLCVLAATPARAELLPAECDSLIHGAHAAAGEARLLINDQIRAWVGLADDRDETGHEARSAEAVEILDRQGMAAWDAYIAAIEADCVAAGHAREMPLDAWSGRASECAYAIGVWESDDRSDVTGRHGDSSEAYIESCRLFLDSLDQ